jgi:superfamily II DNA or RNA helicase
MESVGLALSSMRVDFSRITSSEGAKPSKKFGGKSERERIIESFSSHRLSTLLAIDCLDEGVDIPAARTGFILASSGNPKEFIQRRGRLMRQFPGKEHAEIFDFVVLPGEGKDSNSSMQRELQRVAEFANDAMNKDEILSLVKEKVPSTMGGAGDET